MSCMVFLKKFSKLSISISQMLRGSRTFKVMIIYLFSYFFYSIIILIVKLILVFFIICKQIRHDFSLEICFLTIR